jgi:hypothetical protein
MNTAEHSATPRQLPQRDLEVASTSIREALGQSAAAVSAAVKRRERRAPMASWTS